MTIQILRKRQDATCLEGTLIIEGEKICDTLEPPTGYVPEGRYRLRIDKCETVKHKVILLEAHNVENTDRRCKDCAATDCAIHNVWDKEYKTLMKAIDEEMPTDTLVKYGRMVQAESNAALAKLHRPLCYRMISGNGISNTNDGRIVIGKRLVHGVVTDSNTTLNRLYKRIEKSLARGHDVTLFIG